jgi:hypothetical protein
MLDDDESVRDFLVDKARNGSTSSLSPIRIYVFHDFVHDFVITHSDFLKVKRVP